MYILFHVLVPISNIWLDYIKCNIEIKNNIYIVSWHFQCKELCCVILNADVQYEFGLDQVYNINIKTDTCIIIISFGQYKFWLGQMKFWHTEQINASCVIFIAAKKIEIRTTSSEILKQCIR